MRWNYCKLRQLSLLQSAMDSYYKLRQLFFITKCDTVYYKLRQVLRSAMDLLQIAIGVTNWDDYYKLRQYSISFESKPLKWLSLKRSRIVLLHRFRGNWSSKKFHIKFLTEYWLLLVTAKGPLYLKIHVHSSLPADTDFVF